MKNILAIELATKLVYQALMVIKTETEKGEFYIDFRNMKILNTVCIDETKNLYLIHFKYEYSTETKMYEFKSDTYFEEKFLRCTDIGTNAELFSISDKKFANPRNILLDDISNV